MKRCIQFYKSILLNDTVKKQSFRSNIEFAKIPEILQIEGLPNVLSMLIIVITTFLFCKIVVHGSQALISSTVKGVACRLKPDIGSI